MTAAERLAEITARADEATAEPWSTGPLTVVHSTGTAAMVQTVAQAIARSDAEFIAAARSDAPWLVEQVRKRDTALKAVLDACDRIDASIVPHGDFETGQKSTTGAIRAVIESALRTPFDMDRLRSALGEGA